MRETAYFGLETIFKIFKTHLFNTIINQSERKSRLYHKPYIAFSRICFFALTYVMELQIFHLFLHSLCNFPLVEFKKSQGLLVFLRVPSAGLHILTGFKLQYSKENLEQIFKAVKKSPLRNFV